VGDNLNSFDVTDMLRIARWSCALFQALPAGSTLSAADVPAFSGAKKFAWMPFDERCVPATITIASGPVWAKAENGNFMGKC